MNNTHARGNVVAVRALEAFETLGVGDAVKPSNRWENHQNTGELLQGVCAFDARESVEQAFVLAKAWPVLCFSIRRFAVLAGVIASETSKRTIEPGEVMVKDAVVLEIWEWRDGRYYEVAGQ